MEADALKLITRFNRIHNQYTAVKKNLMINTSDMKLFPAEMHILVAVASCPGCSVTDLSRMLSITRSAVSQLLKKTSAKGLLTKQRDPENERSVLLSITEKGRKAVEEFTGHEQSVFGEFLRRMKEWPTRDIETVDRFMGMLEEMFDSKLD